MIIVLQTRTRSREDARDAFKRKNSTTESELSLVSLSSLKKDSLKFTFAYMYIYMFVKKGSVNTFAGVDVLRTFCQGAKISF